MIRLMVFIRTVYEEQLFLFLFRGSFCFTGRLQSIFGQVLCLFSRYESVFNVISRCVIEKDHSYEHPYAAEMEEAYTELYREFLRLRSLCLKQAALLQQLTETLRRQRGEAPVPDGQPSVMAPIPVQCTQGGLGSLPARPETPMVPTHNPAAHRGGVVLSGAFGSLSDLLEGDLGRLRLDFAHPGTERNAVLKAAPLRPLDLPGGNNGEVAPSSVSGDSKQAGRFWVDDTTRQMFRMPSACGSFLDSEFLSQTGGMMLMSEVAIQSQVCDFCNAVFPGYTTTRGDFLRHLHTHIS